MKKVNIGMLGLGNIGSGTVELLKMNREHMMETNGIELNITKFLVRDINKDRGLGITKDMLTENPEDIFNDPDIDIVVELMGGVDPASAYIMEAMKHGKHVVTANKAALAAHYDEIMACAEENGVKIGFEASVGAGIPVINAITTVLQSNQFEEILGIINGTTNYILTQMTENGMSYEFALKSAQDKGFAEPDPTADVEGYDPASKLSILAAIAFGKYVHPDSIPTRGITKVTPDDIKAAKLKGCVIKLVAHGINKDGEVKLHVAPMELPKEHALASVGDEYNAIFLKTNGAGDLMFRGKGAGPLITASAILGDALMISKNN